MNSEKVGSGHDATREGNHCEHLRRHVPLTASRAKLNDVRGRLRRYSGLRQPGRRDLRAHADATALRALRATGIRRPEEISVIGVDDILISYSAPTLTTIAVPACQLATVAAVRTVAVVNTGGLLEITSKLDT